MWATVASASSRRSAPTSTTLRCTAHRNSQSLRSTSTDIRIGAYIDHRLPGKSNEELRGLTKKASALADKME